MNNKIDTLPWGERYLVFLLFFIHIFMCFMWIFCCAFGRYYWIRYRSQKDKNNRIQNVSKSLICTNGCVIHKRIMEIFYRAPFCELPSLLKIAIIGKRIFRLTERLFRATEAERIYEKKYTCGAKKKMNKNIKTKMYELIACELYAVKRIWNNIKKSFGIKEQNKFWNEKQRNKRNRIFIHTNSVTHKWIKCKIQSSYIQYDGEQPCGMKSNQISETNSTKYRTEIETRIWQKQIYFILTKTSRTTNVEWSFYYFLIRPTIQIQNVCEKKNQIFKLFHILHFANREIKFCFCTNWSQTFLSNQNKLFESIVFIETNLIVKFSFSRHPILFLNWIFWAPNIFKFRVAGTIQ